LRPGVLGVEFMPEKTFEKAMGRLEEIVKTLEQGNLPLEESLKVFEEGMQLFRYCSSKLEEAQKRVALLVQDEDGSLKQVPFEKEAAGDEQ